MLLLKTFRGFPIALSMKSKHPAMPASSCLPRLLFLFPSLAWLQLPCPEPTRSFPPSAFVLAVTSACNSLPSDLQMPFPGLRSNVTSSERSLWCLLLPSHPARLHYLHWIPTVLVTVPLCGQKSSGEPDLADGHCTPGRVPVRGDT